MAAFHLLSKFSDGQSGQLRRSSATYTNSSTRKVWMVYYVTLSRIVREDLVHHPSPLRRDHESLEHKGLLKDDDFFASRVRQRGELQHVEMKYESLLLQETQFPKANETNEEVKSWVELVVGNWRTLCGASWTDEELGPGGKVGVGRSTLAVSYHNHSNLLPMRLLIARKQRYFTAQQKRPFSQRRLCGTCLPSTRFLQNSILRSEHSIYMWRL